MQMSLGLGHRQLCPRRFHECKFTFKQVNSAFVSHNPYGLLTKCEVKMAGYLPSSFLLCVYGQKRSQGPETYKKKNDTNIQPS